MVTYARSPKASRPALAATLARAIAEAPVRRPSRCFGVFVWAVAVIMCPGHEVGAAGLLRQRQPASRTPAGRTWTVPRTPDGDPDLQGVWKYATSTPLERPTQRDCNQTIGDVRIVAPCALADKESLTEEEAAEFERRSRQGSNADRRDGNLENELFRAYNNFWYDDERVKLIKSHRTSLIVDPADGKLPALTATAIKDAQNREAARADLARRYGENGRMDGPEDRPLSERCLSVRIPVLPAVYNNNIQIVQGQGYVVIVNEMIHDARVIPLDGQRRVGRAIRQWIGDSVGHWEGSTLVVETTNFNGKAGFRGATANMRLTERFARIDGDALRYRFTVDDPATWVRPWTAEFPMTKSTEGFFEFACHEGNYGIAGVLRGARAAESVQGAKPRP